MSAGLAPHAPPLGFAMLQGSNQTAPLHSEPPIFYTLLIFPESLPFVLNSKTNLNVLSQAGHTPLTLATRLQNISAVKHFVDYGANPYQQDTQGKTPLDYALKSGNKKLISLLLVNMGFNHNVRAFELLDRTALAQAVKYIMSQGHAEFVSAVTERGRMQWKSWQRQTLESRLTIIEKLQYDIDKGVVLTLMKAKVRQAALPIFTQYTRHNPVDFALLKKALATPASRSTILFELRKYFILELLWGGSIRNIPRNFSELFTSHYHTPSLQQLAMLNFELYTLCNFVESFDQHQPQPAAPSINDQSINGYTLLMVAIQDGDREAINTYLANPELNINLQAKCGLTALIAATILKDVETIRTILTTQAGKVTFNLRTPAGTTALDIAIEMKNRALIDLLTPDPALPLLKPALALPNDDQAQAAPADTAPLQLHTTQPTGDLASLEELDSFFGVIEPPGLYLPTVSAAPKNMSNTTSASIRNDAAAGEPAAKRKKLSA